MSKTVILGENGLRMMQSMMLSESYSDKVLDIKAFLDKNYMRGEFVKDSDGGKKTIGVFIKLTDKGLPTKDSVMIDDVFDRLQQEKIDILQDKDERDKFLMDTIKAWYDKKINDRGSIIP